MTDPGIRTHQLIAGRYRIERELGRGGSAVVYRALDERHDRHVAVKVLHPELATALGAQRFLREIKLTASLQHPHIVPIFDSGETEDGLLFYVMPHVEADSLRRELAAVGRLRIEEALRIAREIAGALAYAHERGVIHRDIKPENILFLGGHACLTDFGIARPMLASGERLTHHDVIVGTPEYMSPEQGRNFALDGRSDVYSLACVLYEMLAGAPPFQADTPVDSLRQRFSHTPPQIRTLRPEIPPALEEVLARALATSPDERYDSARAFGDALAALSGTPAAGSRRVAGGGRRSRWALTAGIAAGVVVIVGAALSSSSVRGAVATVTRPPLDSAAFALVPVVDPATGAASADADALRRALAEWRDLKVLDVSASDFRAGSGPQAMLAAARSSRAASLIAVEVRRDSAGRVAYATLYDVASGRAARRVAIALAPAATAGDSAGAIARALLAAGGPPAAAAAVQGTHSYAALLAYQDAHDALARFDLAAAARGFARAAEVDSTFAAPLAWLAQTMVWERTGGWEEHARRAAARRDQLAAGDRALVEALDAMRLHEHPRACRSYRAMATADSANVYALLGLGDCQALDSIVVRDAHSPSGWVFRGSIRTAMEAYDHAVRVDRRAYAALPVSYLRSLLRTVTVSVRTGHRTDAKEVFFGSPVMVHDTIGYFAWPVSRTDAFTPADQWYATLDDALRWDREELLHHVSAQLELAPRSVEALEGLASVLEERGLLLDDRTTRQLSALGALDSAAHLATDAVSQARVGAARVRVLIKAGRLREARLAADSLLSDATSAPPDAAQLLAPVAEVMGRAALAVQLLDLGNSSDLLGPEAIPQPIRRAARTLTVRAALGVCDDSLRAEFRTLDAMLDSYVEPKARARIARAALFRPVMLAVPCIGPQASLLLGDSPDHLVRIEQALARKRPDVVRAEFDTLAAIRRALRPGDVTLDFTALEAWALTEVGDTAAAVRRLDLVLDAMPTLGQFVLFDVGAAGAVGRTFALRAELAERLHDAAGAARWSRAIAELWAGADPAVKRSVTPRVTFEQR